MQIPCGLLAWILVCAVVGFGCRHDEPTSELIEISPPEVTPVPAELSDEQKAAIEAIAATGGVVDTDDAGFPVRIDLASERVFADEALIRAALRFPNLKGLRLAVSSVPEGMLSELATLTCLDELFLQDATLDDPAFIELLQAMPDLRRLTLRRVSGITDGAFVTVAACERLEVLALIEMNELTSAGLARLANVPRLRSLDLRNCGRLTVEDFQRLAALEGLVEVKLAGPAINDEIADVIHGLPQVHSITIEDAEISPALLGKLAGHNATAERIRSLAFARCFGVPDDAFNAIVRFPNLETLALNDLMVNGAFLHTLSKTGKSPLSLKTLVITNAFLDAEAVDHLPNLTPNLQRLDLRGSVEVTEEIRQALKQLKNLKDLKLE